jgi:flagellar biosynthesis/type III secretory pathway protein FliH
MGRVIRGARRVPAAGIAAHDEARRVREQARLEAAALRDAARDDADRLRETAQHEGRAAGIAQAAGLLAAARTAQGRTALASPELAALALAVARRVVADCRALDPELVARRTADVVRERFLGPVLVRTGPGEVERIRRAVAETAAGPVTVREDPELPPGTCVLEGDGGEIRLDDEEMLQRVGQALTGEAEAAR